MKKSINNVLDIFESLLSVVVVIGVVLFAVQSLNTFWSWDWGSINTFYSFINYLLAIVVGIEFAKLLITHDIYSIATLLNFVVARKLLTPDLTAIEMLYGIIAFAILFVLNIVGKSYKNAKKIPQIKIKKVF